MFEIKKVDVSIISELEKLQTKMQTARDGKDPNCKLCNDAGTIAINGSDFFSKAADSGLKGMLVNIKCDCYSLEKTQLTEEIEKLLILQKQFRSVFGVSEYVEKEMESLTLSSCERIFSLDSTMSVIKKWLSHSMPCSLFLTGKPGTGKTTTLKMLWQIMAINGIGCYFFDCLKFEELCFNLFNKDESHNIKNEINKMVDIASRSDLLLMDEHASINLNTALIYYFKIFNARSESKKPVVIVSNKTFGEVITSYNHKNTQESILMRDKIYSRLVERMKIAELTFEKSEVKQNVGVIA